MRSRRHTEQLLMSDWQVRLRFCQADGALRAGVLGRGPGGRSPRHEGPGPATGPAPLADRSRRRSFASDVRHLAQNMKFASRTNALLFSSGGTAPLRVFRYW